MACRGTARPPLLDVGGAAGGVNVFIRRVQYPPDKGSRSTQGGRGHRKSQSKAAKEARRQAAWKAWDMRVLDGRSIRDIAVELGVAKTTVGEWLKGVPRVSQPPPAPPEEWETDW